MRARAGFTLIELTVVLFIIAVAAAVTVPAILDEPVEADVVVAGRQLEKLFRIARDSAQRSGAPVTVSIDSLSGMIWVASVSDTASVALTVPGFILDLPASVRLQLTKSRARFEFAPTGAVFGDTLQLRTPLATRTVTIDPWTGDAIVH